MAQIYELNKAMSIFETVNPELFRGYKSARALLTTGGGKAKGLKGVPKACTGGPPGTEKPAA